MMHLPGEIAGSPAAGRAFSGLPRIASALAAAGLVAAAVAASQIAPSAPASPDAGPAACTAAILSGAVYNPRDASCDPDGRIFVLDRTARVFVVGADGVIERIVDMPEKRNGNPQGICVSGSGELYVADTHCNRVLVFSPRGQLVRSWGSYGDGPGQFRYVTSVAVWRDGRVYAAEYGGNDRIQVFREDGTWLGSFGRRGSEPGALDRPSGLALAPCGRLYVADSCNHRIQVFDLEGRFLSAFGRRGAGAGELNFPWDVDITPSGEVVVVEYGNHRLSWFGRNGDFLRSAMGPGKEEGMLNCPWGVAAGPGGEVYVADTCNDRIVAIPASDSDSRSGHGRPRGGPGYSDAGRGRFPAGSAGTGSFKR